MKNSDPHNDSETRVAPSMGVYDFAAYLAKSLGRALPAVVIIALFGVGTWFFLDKVYLLQSQVIEAERRKNDAEMLALRAQAKASEAADKAQIEILLNARKQISDLNNTAISTSKDLQGLVFNQLESIKKNEELAKLHQEKTENYQAQLESAVKRDLERLKEQIAATEKKAQDIALTQYQRLLEKIQYRLDLNKPVDEQLIDLLQLQSGDPIVRKQIDQDRADELIDWRIRVILGLERFRLQPNEANAQETTRIPNKHVTELSPIMGEIYGFYLADSSESTAVIIKHILHIISNESLPKIFRESIVKNTVFKNSRFSRGDFLRTTSPEDRDSAAKFLRDLIAERQTRQYNMDCAEIEFLGNAIEKLTALMQKVDITSGSVPKNEIITSPGHLCVQALAKRYDEKIKLVNPYPQR